MKERRSVSRFEQCLAIVLRFEGGYVDDPSDPGGATNFGITRRTLARWRHVRPWWKLPRSQVRRLRQTEVRNIYRSLFWAPCRASLLPAGLDLALFDFAVNSGPVRAIRHLQALLGVRRDGLIGPVTLRAVARRSTDGGTSRLIRGLCDRRLGFLRTLSGFSRFGRGWMRRVAAVRRLSLAALSPQPKHSQPQQRKNPMQLLSGYKTYIVALAMLLAGISQILGIDLPGFDGQSAGQLVFQALAVLFLRRGIRNEVANA